MVDCVNYHCEKRLLLQVLPPGIWKQIRYIQSSIVQLKENYENKFNKFNSSTTDLWNCEAMLVHKNQVGSSLIVLSFFLL